MAQKRESFCKILCSNVVNNKYRSIFNCLVALNSGHPVLKRSSRRRTCSLLFGRDREVGSLTQGAPGTKSITKDPEGWRWERAGSVQRALDDSEKRGMLRHAAPWEALQERPIWSTLGEFLRNSDV